MSQFRRHMKVTVDGTELDLVTSARDFAAIERDDDDDAPKMGGMESALRLAHACALRLELPGIPTDYDAFADLVDDFVDTQTMKKTDDGTVQTRPLDEVEPDPIPATV